MKLVCEEVPNGFLATVSYIERKISLNIQSENVTNNVTDNVTNDVTDNRLSLIIEILKLDDKVSTSEIEKKMNVTKRTILRDIEKLKNDGCIERIGADKGGYWKKLIM
jgi:ATP-dependent DNA helicase RecG